MIVQPFGKVIFILSSYSFAFNCILITCLCMPCVSLKRFVALKSITKTRHNTRKNINEGEMRQVCPDHSTHSFVPTEYINFHNCICKRSCILLANTTKPLYFVIITIVRPDVTGYAAYYMATSKINECVHKHLLLIRL